MSRILRAVVLATLVLLAARAGDAGAQTRARAAARPVQVRMPDSIKVTVQGVRYPVSVRLPTVTTRPSRDWFDWLGLIASLLVAPIFALRAARIGARVGGEEARRAAIEVQEREAVDARRLRAEERRENGNRDRALLLRRFERDLATAGAIADGLKKTRRVAAIMPVSAGLLHAMWDSFVLRRDAVMLLADPGLEHEVELFYEWAFSRSALLETWLATERKLLGVANPDGDKIHQHADYVEQEVRTEVERAEGVSPRLRARIEQLAAPPPAP